MNSVGDDAVIAQLKGSFHNQAIPVYVQGQHTGREKGILRKCLCNSEIYKSPERRK